MLHGWQRALGGIALVILQWITMPAQATAVAVASSANFTVVAPTQRLADMAVGQADAFREELAREWLGGDLPPSFRPAAIHISIDPGRSFARTLLDDDGGQHAVWLAGSKEAVLGHLLKHEITHVVLAARFGDQMPVWANEGIASRYDNARRHEIRRQQLAGFVAIDSWPPLERLLDGPVRQPWTYAAAESLTEYLVKQGGRERFLEFVACGTETGWNLALRECYGIRSVSALEVQWRAAVARNAAFSPRAVLRVAAKR